LVMMIYVVCRRSIQIEASCCSGKWQAMRAGRGDR
jgi:hypothetical protein